MTEAGPDRERPVVDHAWRPQTVWALKPPPGVLGPAERVIT